MMRNIRFVLLLIRLKLTRRMVFRVQFFGAFFADGALFAVQLLTFNIIYSQIGTIGDWSYGQMMIFVGTFSMLNGLNMVIYFFGVNGIPGKIREGTLDLYLTKPINPLLRLSLEEVDVGSIPLVAMSGVIVAYGVWLERIPVTLPLMLGYVALTLLMALLYYDVELIIRTLPFLVISANAIERLEGDMLMMNFKIPGVFYKGFFRILFWLILPYGVMATVPTQWLTRTLTPAGLGYGLGVVALFTAFALWFWKFGLRHYKSASS